jgi:hypothetical protein
MEAAFPVMSISRPQDRLNEQTWVGRRGRKLSYRPSSTLNKSWQMVRQLAGFNGIEELARHRAVVAAAYWRRRIEAVVDLVSMVLEIRTNLAASG